MYFFSKRLVYTRIELLLLMLHRIKPHPMVLDGVEVKALCSSVRFCHTKLGKIISFYGAGFGKKLRVHGTKFASFFFFFTTLTTIF